MTLSVLMYVLMMAAFVALAAVLVFDAVAAVRRWSAQRSTPAAAPVQRRSTAASARGARIASSRS